MCFINGFYSTESSVVYSIHFNSLWGEIHIHFGRFNIVKITVILISEQTPVAAAGQLLEDLLDEVGDKLNSFFGVTSGATYPEMEWNFFVFGVRLRCNPDSWSDSFWNEGIPNMRRSLERELSKVTPEMM